jgi:hypothetical protein
MSFSVRKASWFQLKGIRLDDALVGGFIITPVIFWKFMSLLRHYATSRKVAGSIPDKVIGFFN